VCYPKIRFFLLSTSCGNMYAYIINIYTSCSVFYPRLFLCVCPADNIGVYKNHTHTRHTASHLKLKLLHT
jgi:hypothetical protein